MQIKLQNSNRKNPCLHGRDISCIHGSMTCRKENAYSFSYCLFAYFYQDFNIEMKLPVDIDYSIPTTKIFTSNIAKCVLRVCNTFRGYLHPVFSKIFPQICTSKEHFFEFVRWYDFVVNDLHLDLSKLSSSEILPHEAVDITSVAKLLTLCSFIIELVSFTFVKHCFFFTSTAPTCLADMILNFPYNQVHFCIFREFQNFCQNAVHKSDADPLNLSPILKEQAKFIESNYSVSDLKSTTISNYDVLYKKPKKKLMLLGDSEIEQLSKLRARPNGYDLVSVCESKSSPKNIEIKSDMKKITKSNPIKKQDINGHMDNYVKYEEEIASDNSVCDKNEFHYDEVEFANSIFFRGIYFAADYVAVDEYNPTRDLMPKFETTDVVCNYCKKECFMYLEEFVSDFKDTNYAYESE